jgi:hypothetical protein
LPNIVNKVLNEKKIGTISTYTMAELKTIGKELSISMTYKTDDGKRKAHNKTSLYEEIKNFFEKK